jgi:hypothetical protein
VAVAQALEQLGEPLALDRVLVVDAAQQRGPLLELVQRHRIEGFDELLCHGMQATRELGPLRLRPGNPAHGVALFATISAGFP